jgi:putative ATP-grasp target RiPP
MNSRAIWRPQDMFPLSGPADGHHAAHSESIEDCRPFGLRYLVNPDPGSNCDLDLASVRLDDMSQIAIVDDKDCGGPAFKHTSGQTNTTTNVQDRKNADSDTDHEQDKPK